MGHEDGEAFKPTGGQNVDADSSVKQEPDKAEPTEADPFGLESLLPSQPDAEAKCEAFLAHMLLLQSSKRLSMDDQCKIDVIVNNGIVSG